MNKLTIFKPAGPALPAAQAEPGAIRQVQYQAPRTPAGLGTDQMDYLIQLLPPGYERLMRVYSEEQLREQIRQEGREKTPPERAIFPE